MNRAAAGSAHRRCQILGPYRQCGGAVQLDETTIVYRRGIGDRGICTKPLAACGGRELWGLLGYLRIRGRDCLPGAGFQEWRCSINRAELVEVA